MTTLPQTIAVSSPSFAKNSDLREHLLMRFPDAKFNETGRALTAAELKELFKTADGVVVGLDTVNEELLSELPRLKILAKFGVGLDNISQEALTKYNIKLGWTGGINKRSVSELTLCYMLGICRNIFTTSTQLREGTWNKSGGVQFSDKTIGIIGCGNIGSDLVRLLAPFGCHVFINDIIDKSEICNETNALQVSLDMLLDQSEIISLHVPLTKETHHLINEKQIALMRNDAILINTSRGPIVEQNALKKALQEGQLGAAALDVFEEEPPTDLEFLSLPNLVVTPHIGGNAKEAVDAMGASAVQHLVDFFQQ